MPINWEFSPHKQAICVTCKQQYVPRSRNQKNCDPCRAKKKYGANKQNTCVCGGVKLKTSKQCTKCSHKRKLTEEQTKQIATSNKSKLQFVAENGICLSTVYNAFKHYKIPVLQPLELTDELIFAIFKYGCTHPVHEVAKHFNITQYQVNKAYRTHCENQLTHN